MEKYPKNQSDNDYIHDPKEELSKINKKIFKLKILLNSSKKNELHAGLQKEIAKLEKYKEQIYMTFEMDAVEPEEKPVAETEESYPSYLSWLLKENPALTGISAFYGKDMMHASIYLTGFEKHFLGFLSERRLKLDFQYSLERDTFYHKYQIMLRKVEDFRVECERIENERQLKNKIDPFDAKRKLKMQNLLFVEISKYFKQIRQFCDILLSDMKKDQVICLNHDDAIEMESFEDKNILSNMTVRTGIQKLRDFSIEIIEFLNMPDFM